MREGDIYIMNDPYLGGTHLPDIALVMPDLHGRAADCLERRDDPPPGRGRNVPGVRSPERDRDLPGGDPHPAPQVPGRWRGQPDPRRSPLPQRARPGYVHGRPQRPGRGVLDRRAPGGGARRALRREPPPRPHRGAPRPLRAARAAGHRAPSGRALFVRGLARQRRRRPRRARPGGGRGRDRGRPGDDRLRGHEPAGARALQLRAFGGIRRRVLRGARDDRPVDPDQRRAASGRSSFASRRGAS